MTRQNAKGQKMRTTMERPPPVNLREAMERATGTDELRRLAEKLKEENEALRKRIAELQRSK